MFQVPLLFLLLASTNAGVISQYDSTPAAAPSPIVPAIPTSSNIYPTAGAVSSTNSAPAYGLPAGPSPVIPALPTPSQVPIQAAALPVPIFGSPSVAGTSSLLSSSQVRSDISAPSIVSSRNTSSSLSASVGASLQTKPLPNVRNLPLESQATAEEANSVSMPYSSSYAVKEASTGDEKTVQEENKDGVTTGSFQYVRPDGTLQIVKYTVTKSSGFEATVEEQAGYAAPIIAKAAVSQTSSNTASTNAAQTSSVSNIQSVQTSKTSAAQISSVSAQANAPQPLIPATVPLTLSNSGSLSSQRNSQTVLDQVATKSLVDSSSNAINTAQITYGSQIPSGTKTTSGSQQQSVYFLQGEPALNSGYSSNSDISSTSNTNPAVAAVQYSISSANSIPVSQPISSPVASAALPSTSYNSVASSSSSTITRANTPAAASAVVGSSSKTASASKTTSSASSQSSQMASMGGKGGMGGNFVSFSSPQTKYSYSTD